MKQIRKKLLGCLLMLCIVASAAVPVLAAGETGDAGTGFINPFADVRREDWFYDSVRYAFVNGLMNGTGGNAFSPGGTTSRAMLVTILYRLEGSPEFRIGDSFEDVQPGAWYADAVHWAHGAGIVSGYSAASFGPQDAVTREQTAVILFRYAARKGIDCSARGDLSAFSDRGEISGWAMEGLQWAVGSGLINGRSGSAIAPKDNTVRSETATLLMRFREKFIRAEAEASEPEGSGAELPGGTGTTGETGTTGGTGSAPQSISEALFNRQGGSGVLVGSVEDASQDEKFH